MMERRKNAVLVHGFASNGEGSIHLLAPYFEAAGYSVRLMDYLWTGLLGVRLCNAKIAKAVSQLIPRAAVGVGHSNGCAILAAASRCGAPFSQLVFLDPALDPDAAVGPEVERIHVWTARKDWALKLAKLLIAHPWGDMGAKGYIGSDRRFINHGMSVQGHNALFDQGNLEFFGPLIVGELARRKA